MISPYSISLALAMTYNGAAGDTKAAMAKTLAVSGMSDEQLNQDCEQMIESVEKADPSVKIESANGAWAQSGFSINPAFLKVAHQFFDATVGSVRYEPIQKARQHDQRMGESQHSWQDSDDCQITRPPYTSVLISAIYFKGRWQNPFNKSATEPRPFQFWRASHTGEIQVPMMVQGGKYQYLETDTFQAIALPYGNTRFQM